MGNFKNELERLLKEIRSNSQLKKLKTLPVYFLFVDSQFSVSYGSY
ncbi:MAG: hypothetical protein ABIH71_07605 [Candidatus Omnitrophota bacterium]|nr:hypothetical protein [Candidatus Omnitrophota bacterium]